MNKILKVLALGAMALSTTACSDFLEVNPRTQVSETEFYKTEDDMMKVRNLGRKSLEEVICKMASLGFNLRKDDE